MFVFLGILVAANALISVPNAFGFGVTAVALQCVVGLGLVLSGLKMLHDFKKNERI